MAFDANEFITRRLAKIEDQIDELMAERDELFVHKLRLIQKKHGAIIGRLTIDADEGRIRGGNSPAPVINAEESEVSCAKELEELQAAFEDYSYLFEKCEGECVLLPDEEKIKFGY